VKAFGSGEPQEEEGERRDLLIKVNGPSTQLRIAGSNTKSCISVLSCVTAS
jgi:hypothetical protein